MTQPDTQIAVTLFNLRDYCQTESDLDRTLDKLCTIGYRAVQVSGVPLDAGIIRKQLDSHQLTCIATHENFSAMCNTDQLIERMKTLDCDFAAMGAMPQEYRDNIHFPQIDEFISIVNEKCAILKAAGIRFGYLCD